MEYEKQSDRLLYVAMILIAAFLMFTIFRVTQCSMLANEQMKEVYLQTGEYPRYLRETQEMLPPSSDDE